MSSEAVLWPVEVQVLPADHTDSPFNELDIAEIGEGLGRTRVRQHVNPLRREHQEVTAPPDWHQTYQHPGAPLVVDLGCGPGRFLLLFKHRHDKGRVESKWVDLPPPGQPLNMLGLEIRKPLVERADQWCERLGYQSSVSFLMSNATISLGHVLASYPGSVQLVCIQFPDPHFKRRHFKRRIFQPKMVQAVAQRLAPGGFLLLQSDVLEVAVAMRNIFEKYAGDVLRVAPVHHAPAEESGGVFHEEPPAHFSQRGDGAAAAGGEAAAAAGGGEAAAAAVQGNGQQPQQPQQQSHHDPALQGQGSTTEEEDGGSATDDDDYLTMASQWAAAGWLRSNPVGVPTEREHYVLQQGMPVYRVLLVKPR